MKTAVLSILISGWITSCAAPGQKVEPSRSTDPNANVGVSSVSNVTTAPATGETSKLPAEMPPTVQFHYMYHNGQMTLTTIDVKNGIVEYEHRESGMSPTIKRKRTLSSKELEALYRVFVDNRFDLIRNDPRVEYANDTSNDRISIDLGPGSYIQIVFDPIMSPLSGESLKRFEAIKNAMFKLLDLEAAK